MSDEISFDVTACFQKSLSEAGLVLRINTMRPSPELRKLLVAMLHGAHVGSMYKELNDEGDSQATAMVHKLDFENGVKGIVSKYSKGTGQSQLMLDLARYSFEQGREYGDGRPKTCQKLLELLEK